MFQHIGVYIEMYNLYNVLFNHSGTVFIWGGGGGLAMV